MKKVLLLGDSIRMNYMPRVKELLEGRAEVWGPADNCRFAKYTLWNIGGWLGECGKPDIIHWNNGIWDVFYSTADKKIFTPVGEYLDYLERIIFSLKKTGAPVVWASTTAVHPEFGACKNDEIDAYNAAAAALMAKNGIETDDLNAVMKKDIEKYISDDKLHLSEAGIDACARSVVASIEKYL